MSCVRSIQHLACVQVIETREPSFEWGVIPIEPDFAALSGPCVPSVQRSVHLHGLRGVRNPLVHVVHVHANRHLINVKPVVTTRFTKTTYSTKKNWYGLV